MDSYVNVRINGKNLESKKDIEKAILKFDEELEKYPDEESAIVGKSVLLYKLEKFDEALNCLNQITDIKHAAILELKAVIFMGLKRYDKSLKLLNEVLKLDSYNINALFYKSECLFQLKRFEEVVNTANLGLKIDKNHQPMLINKFCSLVELNRVNEALEIKDKILKMGIINEAFCV